MIYWKGHTSFLPPYPAYISINHVRTSFWFAFNLDVCSSLILYAYRVVWNIVPPPLRAHSTEEMLSVFRKHVTTYEGLCKSKKLPITQDKLGRIDNTHPPIIKRDTNREATTFM